MVVLGVDPGVATTGYGVVRQDDDCIRPVAYGVIQTPPSHSLPHRLQQLYQELLQLVNSYHPTEASVEELFFARNASTALNVGHARGVILLALEDAHLPTYEYTPLQVKQAITGYGRAGKEQVQEMVRLLLGLPEIPRPDDAADALAAAICHAHTAQVARRLAGLQPGRGS
jgi:crossover junction endodeoxyribonuclease RuvC